MRHTLSALGRRERQIMDIVLQRGRATAAEVLADLPDPPSYSSVRSMLRLLEEKGFLRHQWEGPRHVFAPRATPSRSALGGTPLPQDVLQATRWSRRGSNARRGRDAAHRRRTQAPREADRAGTPGEVAHDRHESHADGVRSLPRCCRARTCSGS
jgi:hypothetical protein